jgi:hypothetical protein
MIMRRTRPVAMTAGPADEVAQHDEVRTHVIGWHARQDSHRLDMERRRYRQQPRAARLGSLRYRSRAKPCEGHLRPMPTGRLLPGRAADESCRAAQGFKAGHRWSPLRSIGTPGRIRTCDQWIRNLIQRVVWTPAECFFPQPYCAPPPGQERSAGVRRGHEI